MTTRCDARVQQRSRGFDGADAAAGLHLAAHRRADRLDGADVRGYPVREASRSTTWIHCRARGLEVARDRDGSSP